MEMSLKKPSGNVGTRTCVFCISSQQKCYVQESKPSYIPYVNIYMGMYDGLEHSISVDC